MQRYFAIDSNLTLSLSDIHHLKNVMRMKVNDKIEVVLNENVYLCKIEQINNKQIKLEVIAELNEKSELPVIITMGISLVTENKFNLILQKLTELGVNSIIPLNTERSIVKLNNDKITNKQERWHKICKEAAEQSRRIIIPKIEPITKIMNLDTSIYDLKLLCSPSEKKINLKDILSKKENYDRILIVIGPEGGFTLKEEQYLVNDGFIKVSLGNRILRTETAPIFVLSILNYIFMR